MPQDKKKDDRFAAFQRGFSKSGKTGSERKAEKSKKRKEYGAFSKLFGLGQSKKQR